MKLLKCLIPDISLVFQQAFQDVKLVTDVFDLLKEVNIVVNRVVGVLMLIRIWSLAALFNAGLEFDEVLCFSFRLRKGSLENYASSDKLIHVAEKSTHQLVNRIFKDLKGCQKVILLNLNFVLIDEPGRNA